MTTAPHIDPLCRAIAIGRPVGIEPGDGDGVIAALEREGLLGIAVELLDTEMSWPDIAASRARERWAAHRFARAQLDLELQRLARAASGSGVARPAIVVKGPVVRNLYGTPDVRTYADIDLLIDPDDIPAWSTVMRSIGFAGESPSRVRLLRMAHHEVVFHRQAGSRPVVIELHDRITRERAGSRIDYRVVQASAATGRFGLLEPEPGVHLVLLSLHLMDHAPQTRRLIWLRDLIEAGTAEVVERARMFARRHDVAWALEFALWRAEQLLGEPRWSANPVIPRRFGLARVQTMPRPGKLYHVALARDLGARAGVAYLASLLGRRRRER